MSLRSALWLALLTLTPSYVAAQEILCASTTYRPRVITNEGWLTVCHAPNDSADVHAAVLVSPEPGGHEIVFSVGEAGCRVGWHTECSFSRTPYDVVTKEAGDHSFHTDSSTPIPLIALYCSCQISAW